MLNLHHLKYFHDAAQAGSLVASAKTNRVSHSAVSQAIRSLEENLGVQLLIHSKRRFELSRQGEALFRRSQNVFSHLDELVSEVRTKSDRIEGPLRLGFSHSIGLSFLGSRIAEFCGNHPQVEPGIRIGNSAALERLLASREIELGFGIEDGSFASYERAVLRRGRFVLIGRRGAKPGRFVVGDKGAEVRALRKSEPQAAFLEVESWEIISRLAQQGMGLGLVPEYVAEPLLKRGGLIVHREISTSYELCAFYRSARTLSPSGKAFLDYLRAQS